MNAAAVAHFGFATSTNRQPFSTYSLFHCPHHLLHSSSINFSKPLMSHHHHLTMSPIVTINGQDSSIIVPPFDHVDDYYHTIHQPILDNVAYDALVWASLHGLLMGDKSYQVYFELTLSLAKSRCHCECEHRDSAKFTVNWTKSGMVPGVGLMHAPFALFPTPFPQTKFNQASHLAPIFNELVDRVSLDGQFLQESLSRTKKVDEFTSRLLDIHSKMLQLNKKEDIRLGLHRSDYMLDEQTKSLLQIELNTISSSFAGFGSLVTELHRYILSRHGKLLGLDSEKVPANNAVNQYAEALAKAWTEYNNPRAVVMIVVQAEERNMYDQHFLSAVLRDKHGITIVRKTLAEVDQEGEILSDGTLSVNGQEVAVIYFRAGYTPVDYPSESEWAARLLMEQSSAIKCPSISYHLVGTKKIQQELAKPGVLERFLENKDDIAKMRECFAGLWSLDDSDIVQKAIERPELFVMKPQREGGGNNIYGDAVRDTLIKLQKLGSQEDAAYILMQRIFPTASAAVLMRNGSWHKDRAISELGIFGTYLRNKDAVIINNQSGYLMRTKISSSDEGGVAAGFAVIDSVYLT